MNAPWKKCLLAVLCLVLIGIGSLCLAPVQTWLARRVLAALPEYQAELQSVRIGWGGAEVRGWRATYDGAVFILPALEVDLPVLPAAWSGRLGITRLVAHGWTLDLTQYAAVRETARGFQPSPEFALLASAHAQSSGMELKALFQGVFSRLSLPIDLTLDGAVLDGIVILPGRPGEPPLKLKVGVVGGGLRAGSESNFILTARTEIPGETSPVSLLEVSGGLRAVMDSPRTFAKLALALNAQASGPAFPQGVQLSADLSAARVSGGENYALTLQSVGKRLLDAQANFPTNSARLGGVWRLDMRDTDVAPFTLGRSLPAFEAVGAGMFETDPAFAEIHAAGRIKSTVSRLETLIPGWSDMSAVTVYSDFDLTQRDRATRVEKLELELAQTVPVLSVRALQSFAFDAATGRLKVADPQGELLAVGLTGVPLAWIQPALDGLDLNGSGLNGQVVVAARDGGMALRTISPLRVAGWQVTLDSQPLLASADISAELAADYNPQGWQATVEHFELSSRGESIVAAQLRLGGTPADGQAMKAAGRVKLNLVALGQQPLAAGMLALTGGAVATEFSAVLGNTQELRADVQASGLITPAETLPAITSTLRASRDATGKITFELPLTVAVANPHRVSDLALAGTLEFTEAGRQFNARLGGGQVYVEDMQLLAVALSATPAAAPTTTSDGGDSAPFWQGWTGEVALDLKSLFYTPQFELRDVGGTVRLEAGELKLDGIKAGAGESGTLGLQGAVNFNSRQRQPYDLQAELKLKDFDSGPIFRALDQTRAPQIEGRFDLDSKLVGHGRNPIDLLGQTRGDAKLSSSGGVFRLLSADVSAKVEQAGRIAAVGAFLGNVASAFGKGGKDAESFANKAQAVSEFSRQLTAIAYDQLTVSIARDDTLATTLRDFSLIAPEMRLSGQGSLTAVTDTDWLEQPFALELQLKARGRTGRALQYLHVLAAEPDALGYAACMLPLRVGGTLLRPDTSALQSALINLAVEQSGAGDLLNRLLGK
ncbi:MAG: hypothetical protein IT582_10600 [Opitutaceae bacterium]|nr:hypothetical protein [Opitutaceae bacterium]